MVYQKVGIRSFHFSVLRWRHADGLGKQSRKVNMIVDSQGVSNRHILMLEAERQAKKASLTMNPSP
jgi:hypothetical protein